MFQIPAGGFERGSTVGSFRGVVSRGAVEVAGGFVLGEVIFLVADHGGRRGE